ncbi:MAG: hypothetical protein M3Z35_09330, partial [Nitrospirota bacterium]|nr:hypothetical protein [Nitrospirota bacterium]
VHGTLCVTWSREEVGTRANSTPWSCGRPFSLGGYGLIETSRPRVSPISGWQPHATDLARLQEA